MYINKLKTLAEPIYFYFTYILFKFKALALINYKKKQEINESLKI